MTRKKNIVVIGLGYVGLANALFLSEHHHVTGQDICEDRINQLQNRISPINDPLIQETLLKNNTITFTTNADEDIKKADLVILTLPTNYDEDAGSFDTSIIESVFRYSLSMNRKAIYVIKSTVPVGFTQSLSQTHQYANLIFMPEFLREGQALNDVKHPDRIIIGGDNQICEEVNDVFSYHSNRKTAFTTTTEAEAIKLFANSYLALRVSFFNEVDTFADMNGLDAERVINGICLDSRIGDGYCNPSFGYGGYCLPKDTKQLNSHMDNNYFSIIDSVIQANVKRKEYINKKISDKQTKRVGIYLLSMKRGSDNYRESAVLDIINRFSSNQDPVLIYDPSIKDTMFNGHRVTSNLEEFKNHCDVIVANRYDQSLDDVKHKVISRDIYQGD